MSGKVVRTNSNLDKWNSENQLFANIVLEINYLFLFNIQWCFTLHIRLRALDLDSCKLACECWELNLDPLEEQSLLLTLSTGKDENFTGTRNMF